MKRQGSVGGAILLLCLLTQNAWAVRHQFFFGIGQSITSGALSTSATNQMTKNTSSVNASGGYYYSQTQLGTYEGSVRDITSAYVGSEVTLDQFGIFTLRGYINASYSNKVNFGNIGNVRNGDLRQCGAGEMPNLSNICYRDEFHTSVPNAPAIKFNANPGFANTLSPNAFMMSYGIGLDVGVNVPFHIIVAAVSEYKKMIPLRLGAYAGIGYEFITYSLGHYDKRTYDNTTTGVGATPGVTLNANDTLYLAGAGAFARVGFSMYATNHIRIDIGAKIPIQIAGSPNATSQKWYQLDSTEQLPPGMDKVFAQQLLRQEHNATLKTYWQFAINVLF